MRIQNNIQIQTNSIRQSNIQKELLNRNTQNISKSVYNSPSPVGANYFNPSFGKLNPETALKRANSLKVRFAQNGLEYVPKEEVWNNTKIFATLEKVGNKFDELVNKNELTGKNLNLALAALLPVAISSKIKVKDFSEFREYLENGGYSPSEIEMYMKEYRGMQVAEPKESTIYLHTEDAEKSKENKISLKTTFLHELKHALSARSNNINASDKIKFKELYSSQKTSTDETEFYNKMFMLFEQEFSQDAEGKHVEINKQSMIDNSPYFTEEQLLADMNEKMQNIINKEIETSKTGVYAVSKLLEYGMTDKETLTKAAPNYVLDDKAVEVLCTKNPKSAKQIKNIINNSKLPDNAFSSKTFWEHMQHKAKDEKEAYKTESVYREYFGNKNQPVDFELQSLMYGEMEKFFRQKAKYAQN